MADRDKDKGHHGARPWAIMPDDTVVVPTPMIPDLGFAPPEEVFEGLKTPRERAFVMLYVLYGGDRRRAYLEAGFGEALPGEAGRKQELTAKQAYSQATMIMNYQRPILKVAIARLQAYYSAKLGLDTENLLFHLKSQMSFDPADIYDAAAEEPWTLKPIDEWPLEARISLTEIRHEHGVHGKARTYSKTTVKFADKQKAIDLLGQYLNLWEQKRIKGDGYTLIINAPPSQQALPEPKSVTPAPDLPPRFVIDLPTRLPGTHGKSN